MHRINSASLRIFTKTGYLRAQGTYVDAEDGRSCCDVKPKQVCGTNYAPNGSDLLAVPGL